MEYRVKDALKLLRSGRLTMIQDECDNVHYIDATGQICSEDWGNREYTVIRTNDQEFLEKYSEMLFVEIG